MDNYFKSALSDFAGDVAFGDAIRHLAAKGMTVNEIYNNLTYPTSIDNIKNLVWKYYLDSGIIRLNKPENNESVVVKVDYVLEYDKYGRSSYRRVEEKSSEAAVKYVECDFGRRLYNDKENFIKALEKLDANDRDYVLGLPWTIETVYHIKDERIKRIMEVIVQK